jgi:hypothetical protein
MAKSFQPLLAGAVGITLAASCFASDAVAMNQSILKVHAVGGWARTPNVSVARPNMSSYARPIIPYRAPIIPYRRPGATVTTGSMPIVARYRQAQWQQQQVQKQSALWQQQAQTLHQTTLQQTTQQVANTVGTQIPGGVKLQNTPPMQNVPYRCTSLDDQRCSQAAAAANQAAVAAQQQQLQQQQLQQQQLQQSNWRQQQQKQMEEAAIAAQAASLKSQLYLATTQSQVDYIKSQASLLGDPGLNNEIIFKQTQMQLQNQPSIFNSSPGAIGK